LTLSFERNVEAQGFRLLAISCEDAALAGRLDSPHRDPFDRILASQSMRGNLIVLTKDPQLSELGAITFW
jgi:PIN domain nuclease of toxin-antitoxin system